MIITLLSNFKEDERISMDNYRDLLFSNFSNNKKFTIKKFIPNISNFFNSIRYSRYIEYPRVTKKIHSIDMFSSTMTKLFQTNKDARRLGNQLDYIQSRMGIDLSIAAVCCCFCCKVLELYTGLSVDTVAC